MDETQAKLIAMELQLETSALWELVYFHGETMKPFLREGDELVVLPATWRDVRAGDVVTYREEHKFPTRRVVGHQLPEKRFIIKGDSMPIRRAFRVSHEEILGKVIARRRDSHWLREADFTWRAIARLALLRHRLFVRARKAKRRLTSMLSPTQP